MEGVVFVTGIFCANAKNQFIAIKTGVSLEAEFVFDFIRNIILQKVFGFRLVVAGVFVRFVAEHVSAEHPSVEAGFSEVFVNEACCIIPLVVHREVAKDVPLIFVGVFDSQIQFKLI